MAMPRKGSRHIVVDSVNYRWAFSRGAFRSISDRPIIVELAQHPKSTLLTWPVSIDNDFGDDYVYQVTPKLIETGIRKAIHNGWDPTSNGTFRLCNNSYGDGHYPSPPWTMQAHTTEITRTGKTGQQFSIHIDGDNPEPADLFRAMTALICSDDADLIAGMIDDPTCFPCPAASHDFWLAAWDTIAMHRANFDYLRSPAFLAAVSGKSPQDVETATLIATQQSSQHKAAFDTALQDALISNSVFELLPVSAHADLREILAQIHN